MTSLTEDERFHYLCRIWIKGSCSCCSAFNLASCKVILGTENMFGIEKLGQRYTKLSCLFQSFYVWKKHSTVSSQTVRLLFFRIVEFTTTKSSLCTNITQIPSEETSIIFFKKIHNSIKSAFIILRNTTFRAIKYAMQKYLLNT